MVYNRMAVLQDNLATTGKRSLALPTTSKTTAPATTTAPKLPTNLSGFGAFLSGNWPTATASKTPPSTTITKAQLPAPAPSPQSGQSGQTNVFAGGRRERREDRRAHNPGDGATSESNADAAPGELGDVPNVSERLGDILSSSSPLMERAATSGLQFANRRGLGNSSMAAEAMQAAMIDAATPIATRDAELAQQTALAKFEDSRLREMARSEDSRIRELAQAELDSREMLEAQRVAASDRQNLASAVAQIQSNRMSSLPQMYVDPKLPASARSSGLNSINQASSEAIAYMQNLYGAGL